MKKLFAKSDVNGVKQSLIASFLFLLILEPLVNLIKGIATKGILALVDYFYYSCSRINGTIFLCTFAAYMVAVFISREIKGIVRLYKDAFPANKESDKEFVSQNTENTIDSLIEQVNTIQGLKRKKKMLDVLHKGLCIFCIVVQILFFFNFIVYQCFPAIIRESFDRCIIQITPYTEREKIELMQSDWICMDTKADYDLISAEINNIKEENGLK